MTLTDSARLRDEPSSPDLREAMLALAGEIDALAALDREDRWREEAPEDRAYHKGRDAAYSDVATRVRKLVEGRG